MVEGSRKSTGRVVADLMRRNFIALGPEDSLLEAERTMRLARVRCVPVLLEGRLLGVATHQDVARALMERLAEVSRSAAEPVASLRMAGLIAAPGRVPPEAPLDDAAARLCSLESGCLAVVESGPDGERMLGLITETDLLRFAWGASH